MAGSDLGGGARGADFGQNKVLHMYHKLHFVINNLL